jgi:hypothetical protein
MSKIMLLAGIILLASTSACGKAPEAHIYRVDARVEPIVKEFIKDSGGKITGITDLVVEFATVKKIDDKDIIGLCFTTESPPRIALDLNWFISQNDYGKKALLYHELGHCILRQSHRNGILANKCKTSIMSEYVVGNKCLEDNYKYYIDELFSHAQDYAYEDSDEISP